MDPTKFNHEAWNNIAKNTRWFVPVDKAAIFAAKNGEFSIRLTGTKPVPKEWLQRICGHDILCLAGAGGHQGPILAAAGANVTVFDISEEQLAIDQRVATENQLKLRTVQGDMRDLSELADNSFDLIVNPCSLNFCPEVLPVWREAFRVLRSGGDMIAGMINPVNYMFDAFEMEKGKFVVRHRIPYNDLELSPEERASTLGPERPIDFGHTLTDLIGGQMSAGFQMIDFFEDRWGGSDPLSDFIATFIATRSRKV